MCMCIIYSVTWQHTDWIKFTALQRQNKPRTTLAIETFNTDGYRARLWSNSLPCMCNGFYPLYNLIHSPFISWSTEQRNHDWEQTLNCNFPRTLVQDQLHAVLLNYFSFPLHRRLKVFFKPSHKKDQIWCSQMRFFFLFENATCNPKFIFSKWFPNIKSEPMNHHYTNNSTRMKV